LRNVSRDAAYRRNLKNDLQTYPGDLQNQPLHTMKISNNGNTNQSPRDAGTVSRERLLNDEPVPGTQKQPSRGGSPSTVDVRGARLFRFRRPNGGFYWKAEMALNGDRLHRRFEDELHARAWLSLAFQPFTSSGSIDREELNAPFRAECSRNAYGSMARA
jgi:hypothetical protein